MYAGGDAKTLLTDKRDIGRFVARIIKDERTLNQKVFTYSDFISQNEIARMIEQKTGEKLELTHVRSSNQPDEMITLTNPSSLSSRSLSKTSSPRVPMHALLANRSRET